MRLKRKAQSIIDRMTEPEQIEQGHYQEPSYVRLGDIDLFSPHSLEISQAGESGYRRGASQALSLAGDLVRGGATADDLDQLTDLSMDWRYDREPHLAYLDELVQAWRAGARGVTGIDLRDFGYTGAVGGKLRTRGRLAGRRRVGPQKDPLPYRWNYRTGQDIILQGKK